MAQNNAKPGAWAQNATSSRAVRALMHEYQGLQKEPVEGFRVRLLQESDLFHWEVAIFGPPSTPYQGGYFKANMKFPHDYPFSPPSLRFTTKLWHPNVYDNGDLCISILHPPSNDPYSDELACERWNPTQNVRTILMSVISLLNEPNISSPANVDASVMWRRFKEQGDGEYERIVRGIVLHTVKDAEKDKVVVPTSVEDYVLAAKKPSSSSSATALSDLSTSSSSGTLVGSNAATDGSSAAGSSSSRSVSNAHFDSFLEPDEFYDDEDFYDEETDEEENGEEEDDAATRTIAASNASGSNISSNERDDTGRIKNDAENDDDADETETEDDDAVECDKISADSSSRPRTHKGSNGLVAGEKSSSENDVAALPVADDEGHVDEAGDASCVSLPESDTDNSGAPHLRSNKLGKDRSAAHRIILTDSDAAAKVDSEASIIIRRRGSVENTGGQQSSSSSPTGKRNTSVSNPSSSTATTRTAKSGV